jgi:hypothetical protein
MSKPDWDDPAVAEQWCLKAKGRITQYLDERVIPHGRIGEGPAWEVIPYVSIWAIESSTRPDVLAGWVVYGDLPTDYMSADKIRHPRLALKAFADRWVEVAALMARGEKHPTIKYGPDEMQRELAPMLASRAQTLAEWSGDDSLWGPEYD